MIYYINDCVSCGFPCLHGLCPHYKAKHFKCDFCAEEDVKLYEYDGWQICEDCLLEKFDVVEGSDDW